MLKVLTNKVMPVDEQEFFELLNIYFPNIYDVKYLMKSCRTLKGGLQEVADQLEVKKYHAIGEDFGEINTGNTVLLFWVLCWSL